jgi:hypothetical protein
MKPENVTTHEHFFATEEGQENGVSEGRYDAYETAQDECGVWSPTTDLHWPTKDFAEARRLARALAAEYAAQFDEHPART